MSIEKMKNFTTYEEFLKANRAERNENLIKILYCVMLVGPAIAVGVYFGAFPEITYLSCMAIPVSDLVLILMCKAALKKSPEGFLPSFISMLGMVVMITLMANLRVGIYLTYFMLPVMSLLYYSEKYYFIICVISYIGMFVTNLTIAQHQASLRTDVDTFGWFAGQMGGYTIEFIIMFAAGYFVCRTITKHVREIYEGELETERERGISAKMAELARTDGLTGMKNRIAYNEQLEELSAGELPQNFAVVSMDINQLKYVNDNIGHEAGDELIRGAAECIMECFSKYGNAYRVGGDEFIAFVSCTVGELTEAVNELKEQTSAWHGKFITKIEISTGAAYASEEAESDISALLKNADERMYKDKSEYYIRTGKDRRR
ncbi:MAG: GGDEF domain-containing protein [Eubacteriales bacterium]|nr:GGDEF domain-containing protein [Eubacteriales bacterium]